MPAPANCAGAHCGTGGDGNSRAARVPRLRVPEFFAINRQQCCACCPVRHGVAARKAVNGRFPRAAKARLIAHDVKRLQRQRRIAHTAYRQQSVPTNRGSMPSVSASIHISPGRCVDACDELAIRARTGFPVSASSCARRYPSLTNSRLLRGRAALALAAAPPMRIERGGRFFVIYPLSPFGATAGIRIRPCRPVAV